LYLIRDSLSNYLFAALTDILDHGQRIGPIQKCK
jgi:hypothetical protein